MNWPGELCPVHIVMIRDPSVYFQWFNIQNDNIRTAPVILTHFNNYHLSYDQLLHQDVHSLRVL